jgi:hypothetical protein
MSFELERPARQALQIGRVFSRAFKAFGDNPTPFLVISLLMMLLPDIGIAWLVRQSPDAAQLERLLNSAENLTIGAIGRGALIFAALKAMQTGQASVSESLGGGVRMWGPVLGISILTGLGSALAAILLIIPGIFLAVAWSVALPARIDGKPGVTDAITKSFEMTRGSRWAIFAVWLLMIIVAVIVFVLLGVVSEMFADGGSALIDLMVVPVVTAVSGIAAALLSSSIFEDLKLIRGVGSADRTAEIFS